MKATLEKKALEKENIQKIICMIDSDEKVHFNMTEILREKKKTKFVWTSKIGETMHVLSTFLRMSKQYFSGFFHEC